MSTSAGVSVRRRASADRAAVACAPRGRTIDGPTLDGRAAADRAAGRRAGARRTSPTPAVLAARPITRTLLPGRSAGRPPLGLAGRRAPRLTRTAAAAAARPAAAARRAVVSSGPTTAGSRPGHPGCRHLGSRHCGCRHLPGVTTAAVAAPVSPPESRGPGCRRSRSPPPSRHRWPATAAATAPRPLPLPPREPTTAAAGSPGTAGLARRRAAVHYCPSPSHPCRTPSRAQSRLLRPAPPPDPRHRAQPPARAPHRGR